MKKIFLIVFTSLILSSCHSNISETIGNYKGSFASVATKSLIPVNGSIVLENKKKLSANIDCIASSTTKCHYKIEVTAPITGRYLVSISGDLTKSIRFSFDFKNLFNDRPCFKNEVAEFCYSEDQLIISFVDNSNNKTTINLTKFQDLLENQKMPEAPRSYNLSELLDLASEYDFSTRIEFQRYLESKFNAKAMLLSQLPHISTGTVGNLLGGVTTSSLLQVTGDLLPFLLPNRWMQVKEADLLSKAEIEAATIMKLNAVLFTEQLAYNFEKDKNVSFTLRNERLNINQIYNELVMRENLGQLPFGSSQDVLSIINNIDQAILLSDMTIKQDLQALAMSIGLNNPNGITDVNFDINRKLDEVIAEESLAESEAIAVSHEIRQADILVQVAKTQRVERFFSMFDPNVAPQLALGAALFPVAKQSNAQIVEFQLIKAQLVNQTSNKIAGLFDSLIYDMNNDKLVKQSIDIQQKRVNRILDQLNYGTNFVLSDLVGALQDQVSAQVNNIATSALYKVTEAQMDRILLKGIYQHYNSLNK